MMSSDEEPQADADVIHEGEDDEPSEDEGETVEELDDEEPIVKPVTREELEAFKAAQERTGIIYISRIPPGMQPSKVRHLLSTYGEIGRIYLQQEDPKRAYLRRKFTTTKKAHYTEGWIEFKDKKVARAVAEMLNAEPIGGKKGTRWREDIWTMKYLPRFKWGNLTEHISHEAAVHREKLRVELSQSRHEQRDYLRQVELKRVLDKRADRKRKRAEELGEEPPAEPVLSRKFPDETPKQRNKLDRVSMKDSAPHSSELDAVLSSVF